MRNLLQRYIPATDEVWRLQQGSDPEGRFFKALADQGHYRGKGGTRQGVYAMSPAGVLLGSINALDAEKVADMMEQALTAWDNLALDQRRIPSGASFEPLHRWEHSRPTQGLILQSTNRDITMDLKRGPQRTADWNRDHAWFTRGEARAWLGSNPVVGDRTTVPAASVKRLACFHLVDNVRGQTLPFAPAEVRTAELTTEVLGRKGSRVELRISGKTEAETDGTWRLGEIHWKPDKLYPRGMLCALHGRAVYDLDARAFEEFTLVGCALRWGATANNARWRDPAPGVVGFVFQLAPSTPAGGLAPTFIDLYRTRWVKAPEPGA